MSGDTAEYVPGSTASEIRFRVISVNPVEEPKIIDGTPPIVGSVLVEARSGSELKATLTWRVSASSQTPRPGQEFVLRPHTGSNRGES